MCPLTKYHYNHNWLPNRMQWTNTPQIKSFIKHVLLWSFIFCHQMVSSTILEVKLQPLIHFGLITARTELLNVLMGKPQPPWQLLPQDLTKNSFVVLAATLQVHRNIQGFFCFCFVNFPPSKKWADGFLQGKSVLLKEALIFCICSVVHLSCVV